MRYGAPGERMCYGKLGIIVSDYGARLTSIAVRARRSEIGVAWNRHAAHCLKTDCAQANRRALMPAKES